MKRCTHCKHEKPMNEFPNRKGSADGHTSLCKVCTAYNRKRYHSLEMQEKRAAAKRAVKPSDGIYWPATTTL